MSLISQLPFFYTLIFFFFPFFLFFGKTPTVPVGVSRLEFVHRTGPRIERTMTTTTTTTTFTDERAGRKREIVASGIQAISVVGRAISSVFGRQKPRASRKSCSRDFHVEPWWLNRWYIGVLLVAKNRRTNVVAAESGEPSGGVLFRLEWACPTPAGLPEYPGIVRGACTSTFRGGCAHTRATPCSWWLPRAILRVRVLRVYWWVCVCVQVHVRANVHDHEDVLRHRHRD
mgnify:CR=1 FL=1